MYQTVPSNNATTSKDLAEVPKICSTFLKARKETSEETGMAEITRLAAQFNQVARAQDCQTRSSAARSQIDRLHGTLITAELALSKRPSHEERAEIVNSCTHVMSQAMYQEDLVLVQDAAALLWSHTIRLLKTLQVVKRDILNAVDILGKVN